MSRADEIRQDHKVPNYTHDSATRVRIEIAAQLADLNDNIKELVQVIKSGQNPPVNISLNTTEAKPAVQEQAKITLKKAPSGGTTNQ